MGCTDSRQTSPAPEASKPETIDSTSFGADLSFLKRYQQDLVVLGSDSNGARVLISPAYQGRVMTSSATGDQGMSFGWINRDLIRSGHPAPHMNAVGGEERLWLGPEGGQYSLYFKKGSSFVFDNWYVPKEIDTEPFDLVAASDTAAAFRKEIHIDNYSGTHFDLRVDRKIRLLDRSSIDKLLDLSPGTPVKTVAFESDNSITNIGSNTWNKKSGLLSIWILSMMNASPSTTVAVPYKKGDTTRMGKIVTDDYFGKVPADRLHVEDGWLLLKADANHRSKIGVSPSRALPIAASYDAVRNVLTIAQFSLHEGEIDYVNSLWKIQDHPYSGDAVNAYNDGPVDGKQMGRFYELESSSPAAALAPGASMNHVHRTIHISGNKAELEKIARKLFGIGLDKLTL